MKASCADRGAQLARWLVTALFAAMVVGVVVSVSAPAPARAQAGATSTPWVEVRRLIEDSRYREADVLLQQLEAGANPDPMVTSMRAQWLHHQGRYADAVKAYDRALEKLGTDPAASPVHADRALSQTTEEATRGFARYVTSGGHFEVWYDASKDSIILPWLDETLEGAYHEIGYDLGFWPEPPIRVEIFGRAATLAKVSTLSEEAIKTTGTIALCKYNKLMVTSPRGAARGYGWRDTVAHEYVHYVIQHAVGAGIPIWLHEAIAKYLESRWTGERKPKLLPSREELLGRRLKENRIVTFEQMHPSMALLPSAEDAATAYAQVYTVTEFAIAQRGRGVLRAILANVRAGQGVEVAVGRALDMGFEQFKSVWLRYLFARPRLDVPGDFDDEKVEIVGILDRAAEGEGSGDWQEIAQVEARDFLRLGELLRARDLREAAVAEYEKASALLGNTNPVLQNAMARVYLDLSKPERALSSVADVGHWYPGYYPTFLHEGEALNRMNRPHDALKPLEEAAGINPFDPAVLEELARAWEATADPERARWARDAAQRLK
jgi:tetratricopeptide (TPR) repeat protein